MLAATQQPQPSIATRPTSSAVGAKAQRTTGLTGFLVGTCIVGVPNGPSIVNVPCSRTHDARIDTNMSTQAAYCPSGDELFVPQPPNPSLCLNFSDHNP
jgi:hypothetical protein